MNIHNLAQEITNIKPDKLFILVDENTRTLCLPLLQEAGCTKEAQVVCIPADDSHKTIETVMKVWTAMQHGGATRHSCLINLGGGMVTDVGGCAASTFKRGIHFINIPTTLADVVSEVEAEAVVVAQD